MALTGPNLRLRKDTTSTGGAAVAALGADAAPGGRGSGNGGLASAFARTKQSLAAVAAANKALGRRVSGSGGGAATALHQAVDTGTLLPQSLVSRYEKLPGGYPLVLVQLPMFNEEAHCEVVIERACRMEWPRDKVVIQVGRGRPCWCCERSNAMRARGLAGLGASCSEKPRWLGAVAARHASVLPSSLSAADALSRPNPKPPKVCDDSTREDIRRRIDAKVAAMSAAGHACTVVRRPSNVGFKAGNMINGMRSLEGLPWEYVAVFDADFEMPPDFLYQTIWHMAEDAKLAFVQTRWTFTNAYDNLLCWWAGRDGADGCGAGASGGGGVGSGPPRWR